MPYSRHLPAPMPPGERRWVFAGAAALAGTAGYVNVLVLHFFHVPVSHMTGAVSRIGIDFAVADLSDLLLLAGIVFGFLTGATLSGLIIGSADLRPGRRYGVALMLEGALLAAAAVLIQRGHSLGVPLAACACGVQNAMASSYYGLVIRTTHVTGIVTDIGILLGHWLRERRVEPWKLSLLTTLFTGFLLGGFVATFAFSAWGLGALNIAAGGCLFFGAGYFMWRRRVE